MRKEGKEEKGRENREVNSNDDERERERVSMEKNKESACIQV